MLGCWMLEGLSNTNAHLNVVITYTILFTPHLWRSWMNLIYTAFIKASITVDFSVQSFQTHYIAFCCLSKQTSKRDDRGHAGAVEEQDGG